MPDRKLALPIIFVLAALGVAVLVFLLRQPRHPEQMIPSVPAAPGEQAAAEPSAPEKSPEAAPARISTPRPMPAPGAPSPAATAIAQNAPGPTPGPDPESQPRAFAAIDFKNLKKLPDGYIADNVLVTDKGIVLAPPKPGEEGKERSGALESPAQELDFPSNAISPLWKEVTPDGTRVKMEVSSSPDGVNWSTWYEIVVDDDSVGEIKEFYPDGRPNPNYGYTPGSMLFWGNNQYNYYRFRATLSSSGSETPVFSDFRLYYQDSTLGEGRMADPPTPAP